MKLTRCFEEQVLLRRPYLELAWIERIIAQPLRREVQPDGRVRLWGRVPEFGDRILRVVLEPDSALLNAFPDRSYKD